MTNRLGICDTEEEIDDVIKWLEENKENFLYWGDGNASDCDYVFIHLKRESTIKGVLKVKANSVTKKEEVTNLADHVPKGWVKDILEQPFKKYYQVAKAKKVNFEKNRLRNKDGEPIKTMREGAFVQCDYFVPF